MIAWYSSLNIRLRLAILMSVLSVASTIAIALGVLLLWTGQIKNSVHEHLQDNVKGSVEIVERILTFEQQNLTAWAQLDIMVDILSNDIDLRIKSTLEILKKNYQLAGELTVFDAEGNVVASSFADKNAITGNWAKEVVHSRSSRLVFPSLKNADGDITLIQPIVIEQLGDEPSGYLLLTHPLHHLFQTISKSLHHYQISDGEYTQEIYRDSRKNSIIKINDIPLNHGTSLLNNKQLITNWMPINLQQVDKIKLRAAALRKAAFAPVYQTLWLIIKISIIMVIIIIIISVIASRRFVSPIIALQEFSQRVATTGRLDFNVPVHSKDEIGKLALSIKRMMDNLDAAFKQNKKTNAELTQLTLTLEERVSERTEELSATLVQLKQAQSQLVQSEKMSSLGQLVAGIAHELNNPISAIYTNIPILKDYFTDMENLIHNLQQQDQISLQQLEKALEDIEFDYIAEDIHSLLKGQSDSAERIRDIVLSLRNFSRLDEGELKRVDLQEGLDATINILRHEIKNRIIIHRNYQLNEKIECYPGEINQVFIIFCPMPVMQLTVKAISGLKPVCLMTI